MLIKANDIFYFPLSQGLVSMGRIAKFLLLDELDDDTTDYGSVADGK